MCTETFCFSVIIYCVCVCCGFRHLKDVILLTAIVQVLSTISSYFWYLWLLVRRFFLSVSLINHLLFLCLIPLCLSSCLIIYSVCVSGSGPGPPPAVGELPGPLVYGREPVGTRGSEREEAETTRAQTDEEILMLRGRRSSIFIHRI